MHLDIAVGEAKVDEQGEQDHVHSLAEKVADLNKRLNDIRAEQQYQREREAEFRDLSESTNARAVWWSVLQIIVLFAACAWQLRHLKVRSTYSGSSRPSFFLRRPKLIDGVRFTQKFFDKVGSVWQDFCSTHFSSQPRPLNVRPLSPFYRRSSFNLGPARPLQMPRAPPALMFSLHAQTFAPVVRPLTRSVL